MKINLKPNFMVYLLAAFMLVSCVGEGAYELPLLETEPPEIDADQVISIATLYALWLQKTEGEGVYILDASLNGKYLEGYVISSDESGNFYKELYLQDQPENPQSGIKVLLNASPLYSRFNFGRRLFIQLEGLCVGLESGVFSLGKLENNAVGALSEGQMNQALVRDTLVAQIIPKELTVSALTPMVTNQYLRLQQLQFHGSQVMEGAVLTYAGEPQDIYDGERLLESCTDGKMALLSTSSFATFKGQGVDTGSGYIDGIALFDYYGERLVFSVNDLRDIHFENEERCDPNYLVCEGDTNGSLTVWGEDFEGYEDLEDLLLEGWKLYSPYGKTGHWKLDAFSGNSYARISGYNTDEIAMENWLISPIIDVSSVDQATLYLDVQPSYDNGAILQLLVSANFYGNPLEADWHVLDMILPPGPYEGFGDPYSLGPISLSCFQEEVVLAWVYIGSDPYRTTRFHLDNIRIKGN